MIKIVKNQNKFYKSRRNNLIKHLNISNINKKKKVLKPKHNFKYKKIFKPEIIKIKTFIFK